MISNVSIVTGIYEPEDRGVLWLSTAKKHLRTPHSPAHHTRRMEYDKSWENNIFSEPECFWNETLQVYCMYYHSNQKLGLAKTRGTSFEGPWVHSASAVIASSRHAGLYIENDTCYLTYVAAGALGSLLIASAPMSAPETITPIGTILLSSTFGATEFGNSCLVKVGSIYRLYFEYMTASYSWQSGIAECATLTGTYVVKSAGIPSLMPSFGTGNTIPGNCTVSGINVYEENGEYVAYYHSNPVTSQGSCIFVATSPVGDGYNWTIQNNGYPIMRMALPSEVDQVADPCLVALRGGGYAMLFDGYDNASTKCYINSVPMSPSLRQYNGDEWQEVMPILDPISDMKLLNTQPQTTAYSAVNLDNVLIDPAATANMAVTLPRASYGAKVGVNHTGVGAGTVLIGCNASDTILGSATTLSTGQSARFECFTELRWSRTS